MKLTRDILKIDFEEETERILEFIRRVVENSGASGVVLGLSGGVDSSLTAVLCVKALGRERVLGVLMPTNFTPREDVEDALELAETLGIRVETVNIDEISEAFFKCLKVDRSDPKARIPMANIRARIRMIILYYYANLRNYLVAGTRDRSESLIGYFTKYGDGGVDFMPICHLYKTQVRELARHLGVPERIAYKPSSPQLYPGHKATDEIPIDYGKLDLILAGLFDLKMEPEEVSKAVEVPLKVVEEVLHRFRKTMHKRMLPPRIEASGDSASS
ncbi:MAG TPA: NAD+ synthase [Candidatus Bathyarchaeota archaeon]|nr:NAD+ synthase [Candidatus Bathyarchaeota archaeon]